MERPYYFHSNGKRLFGLLHEPDGNARSVGVLFLNAGPQTHVGPQRIYVHAARRYASDGFTCLRMDLTGVGEADGPFPPNALDCHDAADTRGAIDLLVEHGATSLVVLGLCAGARAAVRAALLDSRIEAVACWSAPILSGAPDVAQAMADSLSRTAARRQLRHWAGLFFQPKRWQRYLASPQLRAEGMAKLRSVVATLLHPNYTEPADGYARDVATLLATTRRVLFAYGARDIAPLAEFEEHYPDFARSQRLERRFVVVPDGDHTFASRASQQAVIALTLDWLRELYPARAAAGNRRPDTARASR
jgi:hypothetical protein